MALRSRSSAARPGATKTASHSLPATPISARKSAAALLQAGASVRGGEAESARVDLKKLTSVLRTFRACAGEYLDLVAFGLEQQLSEAERKIVLGLVPKETSEDVRGAIRCALGL